MKQQFPQTPNPERYARAIAARPGIDEEMAAEFVTLAYEMTEEAAAREDIFRYVTLVHHPPYRGLFNVTPLSWWCDSEMEEDKR